jgi:hypothetical protein
MWIRVSFLVLWSCALALALEPSDKKDPIVGEWVFAGHIPVTIKADGTAVAKNGLTAVWARVKGENVERHYQFIWNQGVYVDALELSGDYSKITGRHLTGGRLFAFRTPELHK